MEIWITVIVCVITVAGNILISALQHRKTTALIEYRLKQLEDKQDKHNSLIERTYKLEAKVDSIEERLK